MGTDLYFTASDNGVGSLGELWKIGPDGTLTSVTPHVTNGDYDATSTLPFGIGRPRVYDGELYFAATSNAYGSELYKVRGDGTVVQVADLAPGTAGSRPDALTVAGGALYFVTDSQSIYRVGADGMPTKIPGVQNILPSFRTFNDELYFTGDDGTTGPELWKIRTDGTAVLVADQNPGTEGSYPFFYGFGVAYHGEFYFSSAGVGGFELWKVRADGTEVRAADFNPTGSSNAGPLTVFNDELYISAQLSTGRQLVKLTADGTYVNVAALDARNIGPVYNGELYFSAQNAASGLELWKIRADGSVAQVIDLGPGAGGSTPSGFTPFDGELYFRADAAGTGEFGLWKIKADGSVENVGNLATGDTSTSSLTVYNGELYVRANDGVHGEELFKLKADGTAVLVADVNTIAQGSSPSGYTALDGTLYFTAMTNDYGTELWKIGSDGHAVLAADIWQGQAPATISGSGGMLSSFPSDLAAYNGELYFYANKDYGYTGIGRELYKMKADGSVVVAADIRPGAAGSSVGRPAFTVYRDELYFGADDGTTGTELWKVKADGSVVQVKDIAQGSTSSINSYALKFTEINGELYFNAKPFAGAGYEAFLKVTADGNVVQANTYTSGPIIGYGTSTYFPASDGYSGTELFRQLPSPTGDGDVSRVADIDPGSGSSNPTGFAPFAGSIYFSASDGTSGTELWKLGPGDVVSRVADINPGSGSSSPASLMAFGNALYFTATDGASGTELWTLAQDGLVSRAADISPGTASSAPGSFFAAPHALYFTANDGASGTELWKVGEDGVVSRVADIEPGAGSSGPTGFALLGGRVYFTATTTRYGAEPWVIEADGSVHIVDNVNPANGSSVPGNFIPFATVDGSAPTVSVTSSAATLSPTMPQATITLHFSAPPAGFDATDLVAVGGTVSALTPVAGDATSYTAIFTAENGFVGPASVKVAEGSYTYGGVAGRAGTASFAVSAAGGGTTTNGNAPDPVSAPMASGGPGVAPADGTGGGLDTSPVAVPGGGPSTTPTAEAGSSNITLGEAGGDALVAAIVTSGAAPAADATFAFGFLGSSLAYVGRNVVLTGPDGIAHDVTGIGHLHFIDGTIDRADGAPLVDDLFYFARNPDVYAAHVDPDTHYAAFGWREGRDPNPLFSTSGYLAANPDVAAAGVDPLQHYDRYGWHEGRETGQAFSGKSYLALNPDVAAAGIDPLAHYISDGQAEGRFAPPGADGRGIAGAFDTAFYLANNPDVRAAGIDPLVHFLTIGWTEGRDPDAYFSTRGYLAANPDVAAAGIDPLVHYEVHGWTEGRPTSGFDTSGYLAGNPDVAAAHIDPLQHFLQFGMVEGRHGWEI